MFVNTKAKILEVDYMRNNKARSEDILRALNETLMTA